MCYWYYRVAYQVEYREVIHYQSTEDSLHTEYKTSYTFGRDNPAREEEKREGVAIRMV